MDPFKSNQTNTGRAKQGYQNNPFAKALAEVEKRGPQAGSNSFAGLDQSQSLYNSALANNLSNNLDQGSIDQNSLNPLSQDGSIFNSANQQKQLEQQQETLKKQQMREKLHRMINPVEQTDIFSAREEKRKKDINKIREELKALAEEIAKFYKEIDITLTQDVVSPGQSGVYHENFFEKLREFIRMLRQRISSARTWARQAQRKKKKKKYRIGLDFSNQEAKSTHDMLHHERSNAFGA